MSRHDRPRHRTFGRLSIEVLEDRTAPALFRVMVYAPAGTLGNTTAQHQGALSPATDLQNYTDPNAPPGSFTVHSVNAANRVTAIQQVVGGTITVSVPGQAVQAHTFGPATSSSAEADHKVFWITQPANPPNPPGPVVGEPAPPPPGVTEYEIRMEDGVNLFPNQQPDWDYNDHTWAVRVTDEAADEIVPAMSFVDGNGSLVSHPRVAKWENAFEYQRDGSGAKIADPRTGGFKTQLARSDVGGAMVERDKVIEDDPDKFRIQLEDAKANTNPAAAESFQVKLFTYGEGAYRPVLVTETGVNTGVFRSKTLLLVSDANDDTYAVKDVDAQAGVADNALGDRTFRVLSGRRGTSEVPGRFQMDRLWLSYDYRRAGEVAPTNRNLLHSAEVLGGMGSRTGIVKLHVTILKDATGTAVITEAAVKDMIRAANEIYARVGIHFQLSGAITQLGQAAAGVKMEDDPAVPGDPGGIALGTYPAVIPAANEAGKVANSNRSADTDDIEVYFVNGLFMPTGSLPAGISAPASFVPKDAGAPDVRYRDTVLLATQGYLGLAATKATIFTLAHELGHVLTDDIHFAASGTWEVNLMRAGVADRLDIYDSKRLTNAQQATLYTAWPNLVNRAYADADEV